MQRTLLAVISISLMLMPTMLPISPAAASGSVPFGGFWHLDEGVGTTTQDSTGNGNTGTLYGDPTWIDGKYHKALSFDGVDDYLEVPDSGALDITGKITLEAWIYPISLLDRQVIVCKYNHSSLSSSYYLSLGGTLGSTTYLNRIYFALSTNGNQYYAMVSATNITTSTWTHVAATSNSTHMMIYINGIKDSIRTFPPGLIYAGNSSLRIGCYLPEFGYSRFFNGILDEVRVAPGTIWTVDDDKVQCPNADYTSIQSAINAASACDTVFVHDGTYRETLVINKSLTLKAASMPVIEAPDIRKTYKIPESTATFDPIVLVYGGTESAGVITGSSTIDVTIDGFEIDGRNKAAAAPTRFAAVLCRNVQLGVIADCNVHGMYDADGNGDGPQTLGILLYGDSQATISHNEIREFSRGGICVMGDNGLLKDPTATVEHNTVTGNGLETGTGWWAENGIQVGYGSTGTVAGNKVSQCKVNNPSWVSTGILVIMAGQGVSVIQNDVGDCDTGIAVSAIASPSLDIVEGNQVTGCTWDAIRLGLDGPMDHATVLDNTVSNSMIGIGVWDSSDNAIEQNTIETNQYGIIVDGDSDNNFVAENEISDNTVDGILVEPYGGFDPSGTTIKYNNIVGNTVYGVEETGANLADARFNWWGDATGPEHLTNSDGTGDAVSDNVDYSPWLGTIYTTVPREYHVNPTGTIQEAIDEAASGDAIIVHEGTYNEALYVKFKSLTIRGASIPTIQGAQMRATNYGNRQATIYVEDAGNVVLRNLDIQGQGLGTPAGTKSYAILYENSIGTVQSCSVSPNTIGDMYSAAIAAWDNSNLTISNCDIRNFGRIGVYSNNATLNVEWNTIVGQSYDADNLVNYGIEIEDYSGPSIATIAHNTIRNCNNTNTSPLWSSSAIIVDTWREWADYYNLALLPSHVAITFNDIYDNYEAIEIVSNEYSYAHYNNFHNNAWGVWSAPENWTTNPAYYVFDARFNWWGDATGPNHDSSWEYQGQPYGPNYGLGDIVSDYVLYCPWQPVVHDVAVTEVSPSPTVVTAGDTVTISVTAQNQGSDFENFTVTVYHDSTPIATKNVINLFPSSETILTFIWDTTGMAQGSYTIKAEASTVPEETDVPDNILVNGQVEILWHDAAVTDVVADRTWVYQGHKTNVSVTVTNQGDFTETVEISLYYNITNNDRIDTQTITLLPGENRTLIITWNTGDVPYCRNYTLVAVASIVPTDNDPADNTFENGILKVRIMGDVNNDGTVNMLDLWLLSLSFGRREGDVGWNPDLDLNQDHWINMIDLYLTSANFGKTCS